MKGPQLAPGWQAFVDAAWLSSRARDHISAIHVDPGGSLRWPSPDSPAVNAVRENTEVLASRAMAWAAGRAAAAAAAADGPVDVVGSGALAEGVRRLLGDRCAPRERTVRPFAVVITDPDVDLLIDAMRRVVDLGRVLVASDFEPATLDLYPDVHSRGLALVGVPGPLEREGDLEAHPLESFFLESLVHVPLTDDADNAQIDEAWYRFGR